MVVRDRELHLGAYGTSDIDHCGPRIRMLYRALEPTCHARPRRKTEQPPSGIEAVTRQAGYLVTRCRSLTMAKVDSTGLVRRWIQCSGG
jgi:hypothetical protein